MDTRYQALAKMNSDPAGLDSQVLQIIGDYLDVPVSELRPERSLEELGADSLDFVELVFELEEKLGVKSDGDLFELRKRVRTIGDVLGLISELVSRKNSAPPPAASSATVPSPAPDAAA